MVTLKFQMNGSDVLKVLYYRKGFIEWKNHIEQTPNCQNNIFNITIYFIASDVNCGLPPDKPFGGSTDWNGVDTTYATNIT